MAFFSPFYLFLYKILHISGFPFFFYFIIIIIFFLVVYQLSLHGTEFNLNKTFNKHIES